jgi:hypothetical protein
MRCRAKAPRFGRISFICRFVPGDAGYVRPDADHEGGGSTNLCTSYLVRLTWCDAFARDRLSRPRWRE